MWSKYYKYPVANLQLGGGPERIPDTDWTRFRSRSSDLHTRDCRGGQCSGQNRDRRGHGQMNPITTASCWPTRGRTSILDCSESLMKQHKMKKLTFSSRIMEFLKRYLNLESSRVEAPTHALTERANQQEVWREDRSLDSRLMLSTICGAWSHVTNTRSVQVQYYYITITRRHGEGTRDVLTAAKFNSILFL